MSRLSKKLAASAARKAEIVALARTLYADGSDDDIEIDDNPATSESDHGTWVAAWVHVPNSKEEDR